MLFRLPLLLAFVLSLAFGPAPLPAACVPSASPATCGACCSEPGMACCAFAASTVPAKAPDTVAPTAADGKVLAAAHFMPVYRGMLPMVNRATRQQSVTVHRPVVPRLDVTCIRLI